MDVKPYTFAYSELKNATRDFNPSNKLGEGGFGTVYKVSPELSSTETVMGKIEMRTGTPKLNILETSTNNFFLETLMNLIIHLVDRGH